MKLSDLAPGQHFVFKGSSLIYKVVEADHYPLWMEYKTRKTVWKWRGFFRWPFVTMVMIYSFDTRNTYFNYGYHEVQPV